MIENKLETLKSFFDYVKASTMSHLLKILLGFDDRGTLRNVLIGFLHLLFNTKQD